MADKDFVVKNGIVVNTAVTINSTAIHFSGSPVLNSTSFSGTANNAAYLGGTVAAAYLANTDSKTLSGNIAFTGANVTYSTGWKVGANVIANTTSLFVGNSTVNAYITSNGLFVNGAAFVSGGGYYKGNLGAVGNANNVSSLFRINANTMTADITIAAGENAQATGPLVVQSGITLSVATGGRISII